MSEMELTEGQLLSQDFGVGGPPATADMKCPSSEKGKSPEILAAEIREIKSQLGIQALNAAINTGRKLTAAKLQLPHGKWGEYLKNEVDYSPSQAQNLMRIYREYGNDQLSLFGGEVKSQTFGALTPSKALKLLAIPDEEERERFVVENDVEHMSVRELNEALKARDEAQEAAVAAQEEAEKLRKEKGRLQEQLGDQARGYEAKLTSAGIEVDQAKADARAAREALERQQEKAQRLQDALSEANTSAQAAEESLEAAQKELADLKAKGPEVRELTQEEKDALTAEAVSKAKAEGAEQIRDLKKKLAAADPNVAKLMVLFGNWRKTYEQMMEILNIIAQDDEDQAARLRQGVKAALEQMATS